MTTSIPRPEHPRPQFVREAWSNLNGEWEFEVDRGDTGLERGLLDRPLGARITVPFAPESIASGIGDIDFLHAVWYRRTVDIPLAWSGRDVLLHFGAVDHDATVWVDGVEVMRHRGGFSSFTVSLAGVVAAGTTCTVVVRARDTPDQPQARGKQSTWYRNTHANYTRTTGIWQTVWMEAVAPAHLRRVQITPQLQDASFLLAAEVTPAAHGTRLEATVTDVDGVVATATTEIGAMGPHLAVSIPEGRVRPWSPTDPHLYGVELRLLAADGEVVDEVESYAGLRSVAIDGDRVLINGEPVFQRLVLDQGYWPDTLMTAPTDDALRQDIELAMAAGFNGARLHQKVFEERYYFHADRLGYLVWGEFGDWGVSGLGPVGRNQQPTASFITQWLEVLLRDRSHPSIIGWCPLNETHQRLGDGITQLDDVTLGMYLATKAADPTRPVIDASGYSHRVRNADVYDSHSYEQDPEAFRLEQSGLAHGRPFVNLEYDATISIPYAGQPYFVSEYGGIWWNADEAEAGDRSGDPDRETSWGYGDRVRTIEQWYQRYEGLTNVLLDDPAMFGYCFTQLTDTFQEQNGIYDFERRPKFDLRRLHAVQSRRAAYEDRSR
jgi:beta-galactosidase/beta-glucuronidase